MSEEKVQQQQDADAKDGPDAVWNVSAHGLAEKFKTKIDLAKPGSSFGLTSEEALKRLQEIGRNEFTPPAETPEIVKYLMQFLDPFMLMLIGAGVLSAIAYGLDTNQPINLWLAVVLWVVTFISCTFAYVQEV
jgi:sodium/potassium-transporting ATPase subunit alpha